MSTDYSRKVTVTKIEGQESTYRLVRPYRAGGTIGSEYTVSKSRLVVSTGYAWVLRPIHGNRQFVFNTLAEARAALEARAL